MANHKSAEKTHPGKRNQACTQPLQNKTTRTQIKKLMDTTKKRRSPALLKEVTGMIDKLAKEHHPLEKGGQSEVTTDQEM